MNLHESPQIFIELVRATAAGKKIPEYYVEKDYWITHGLKRLHESKYSESVVFKGGTSLSKAHRILERFSEDIDLALRCGENMGDSRRKTLMKGVEKTISHGLRYQQGHPLESKHGRFRKTAYTFPAYSKSANSGQVSEAILIEINSFADPKPTETLLIESLIGEFATGSGHAELVDQFALEPFELLVLSVERTLCEKIMGLVRAGYEKRPMDEFRRRIRHFYDISIILRREKYRRFVSANSFVELLEDVRRCDRNAIPNASTWLDPSMLDATVFSTDMDFWQIVGQELNGSFIEMVYEDELPKLDEVRETFALVRNYLPQ